MSLNGFSRNLVKFALASDSSSHPRHHSYAVFAGLVLIAIHRCTTVVSSVDDSTFPLWFPSWWWFFLFLPFFFSLYSLPTSLIDWIPSFRYLGDNCTRPSNAASSSSSVSPYPQVPSPSNKELYYSTMTKPLVKNRQTDTIFPNSPTNQKRKSQTLAF